MIVDLSQALHKSILTINLTAYGWHVEVGFPRGPGIPLVAAGNKSRM